MSCMNSLCPIFLDHLLCKVTQCRLSIVKINKTGTSHRDTFSSVKIRVTSPDLIMRFTISPSNRKSIKVGFPTFPEIFCVHFDDLAWKIITGIINYKTQSAISLFKKLNHLLFVLHGCTDCSRLNLYFFNFKF